jgi:hypothetical protein
MRRSLNLSVALASTLSLSLAACGAGSSSSASRATTATPSGSAIARWRAAVAVRGVLDLSVPRADGKIVVASAGHLLLFSRSGALQALPASRAGYVSPGGDEPYIALSSGERVPGAGCRFAPQAVYVLRLRDGAGVTVVDAAGDARTFVRLHGSGVEDGIAFDTTGSFGHRLLVTDTSGSRTTVYAIDCRGAVSTITTTAPRVEGGIVVAPTSFGRFAGDLIAPDEGSGRIYAISPQGHTTLVAEPALARGGDIGVESAGFSPAGFGQSSSALVADRRTPGNPHPGDDEILRIDGQSLIAAGVRPGDLLVATEGGGETVAITCTAVTCVARHVADGPAEAHVEGHIVFTGG